MVPRLGASWSLHAQPRLSQPDKAWSLLDVRPGSDPHLNRLSLRMVIIMKTSNQKPLNLPVTFVGIKESEQAPHFAVYQIDTTGRLTKKVGGYDGKALSLGAGVARVQRAAQGQLGQFPGVRKARSLAQAKVSFCRATSGVAFIFITRAFLAPCKSAGPGTGICSTTFDCSRCLSWHKLHRSSRSPGVRKALHR